uniref:Uncharacterized protein n=1 Tax=Siphoviridae sp. ctwQT14 TaxID=2827971 RepID=A0A8S5TKE5_9CAUD|nr:MAG TPA: hypothetical protein [Siphoviridae sp. ctwQT14]
MRKGLHITVDRELCWKWCPFFLCLNDTKMKLLLHFQIVQSD